MVSCIERYDLKEEDQDLGIVVESYISNVSYSETQEYPSNGRCFKVILHKTSDVINKYDEYFGSALVVMEDDAGNAWVYVESEDKGHYYLYDNVFKAKNGVNYRLNIVLDSRVIIASDWQKMPIHSTIVNNIRFEEDEIQRYSYNDKDRFTETVEEVNVLVSVPEGNKSDNVAFYRWKFDPLWVFKAPYLSIGHLTYECWVTSDSYLSGFELEKQNVNGFDKELFFVDTHGNERIYEYFSVLIKQQVLNPDYYNFWKELKGQSQKEGLFDEPPFSLKSNYFSTSTNINVFGYFGVVTENATRWVFDKDKLSYYVENDLKERCDLFNPCPPPPPCEPPSCSDCLRYVGGIPTTESPYGGEVRLLKNTDYNE